MSNGQSWPADKVERRSIETFIPYARNSSDAQRRASYTISGKHKRGGFTNLILVDPDGEIIAGHGRLLAAKKLNLKDVPCITADG